MLADEVKQVIASRLNKLGAQENVVVNVIDADGQRPHGDRDVIAFQLDSLRLGRLQYGVFAGHVLRPQGSFQPNSRTGAGQAVPGAGVTR